MQQMHERNYIDKLLADGMYMYIMITLYWIEEDNLAKQTTLIISILCNINILMSICLFNSAVILSKSLVKVNSIVADPLSITRKHLVLLTWKCK